MNIFNRNEYLEKEIDIRLYKKKGCDGLRVYSIYIYIDRLNECIDSFDQDGFAKKELEKLLKYHSKLHFDYDDFPTEMKEHIRKLYEFVKELKYKLNIPYVGLYQSNVNNAISDFISKAVNWNFKVNDIVAAYSPYAQVRDYGLILVDRYVNYIYICGDGDVTQDLKGKSTYILYKKDNFNSYNVNELISLPNVHNVISFVNNDDFDIYHKLYIKDNHRRTYIKILDLLTKKYPTDDVFSIRLKEKTRKIIERISYFQDKFSYGRYERNKSKFKYEIKAITANNQSLIHDLKEFYEFRTLVGEAEYLTDNLGSLSELYSNYHKINSNLHDSLNVIKKNRFLYRGRSKGSIFSEENLSAILKTMLEIKFDNNFVSVNQEAINGAGFTDIEIEINRVTVSIIECKLLNKNKSNNIESSLSKGIDQIIYRYSNPIHKYFDMPPKLFLLLFCVDPEWGNIRKKTFESLDAYCRRNNYKLEIKENYNTTTLCVSLNKEDANFGIQILNLDIVICELEDKIDLDRTNLKPYDKNW